MTAKSRELTPMLRHYLEVKAEHPEAVVLYRMGDFYEAFFEDAERIAPILEVALTARGKGTPNEAPMCGVPHHALEGYLAKLIRAGLKVAICDQVEDPKEAKGLVRREVTRIVTPGTVSEPQLLEQGEDNFVGAVAWDADLEEPGGLALLDLSTARLVLRRWRDESEALEDLALWRPREVVYDPERVPASVVQWIEGETACGTPANFDRFVSPAGAAELLRRQLGAATLRGFELDENGPQVHAAAMVLAYARETQKRDLPHLRRVEMPRNESALLLDATTLANLEIFHSLGGGGRRATLIGVVDRTRSAPGARRLAGWLRRPLTDVDAIGKRHDSVEALVRDPAVREALADRLSRVGDPERLLTRAVLGSLAPREAVALRQGLSQFPELLRIAATVDADLLRELGGTEPAAVAAAELERVLVDEPASHLRDGGVVRPEVDAELAEARSLARDSKRHLLALETKERDRTGIGSLKVRFNKVFGYYLEVTKANADRVPEDYIRKQTLTNAERFITPALKELEEKILAAEERQVELETRYYEALLGFLAGQSESILLAAAAVSRIDALVSLAEVAERNGYVRPRMAPRGSGLRVSDGRHPVVERLLAGGESFVPNDTEIELEENRIVLLTGPNMGGKSTYLRQVALLVILAQAGGFVPAASAEIGVVDRIFTRVGASDDLARGESTFMVEMIETAKILHHATSDSLVILDEVGRGTATFDGLSLAWAIVEFLHENAAPATLFATHYHELTELAALLPRVVNRTMAVKEWRDRIVFLRRVVPGSVDKSYGLHVARLAGIPESVVVRASEILANLEAHEYDVHGKPRLAEGAGAPTTDAADQMTLFAPPEQVVAQLLRDVDTERLTPLAALNLVHTLKKRLGGQPAESPGQPAESGGQKGMSSSSGDG